MNERNQLKAFEELDCLDDLDEINPYLAQLYRKLGNIKLTYHILYYSPDEVDDVYESQVFEDPEDALQFYISKSEELAPKLTCSITGTVGNFSYSCTALLTLRSLVDLSDAAGKIPDRIKDTATKALAKKIHYNLPFNCSNHEYII
jgi:hypothetical protein